MPRQARHAGILAMLVLPSAVSCTDLQLARYRDDRFLASHRYRLGEQFAEVDGLRLCYQESGAGPPVVILPGLGTSIDYWQLNIPVLAEKCHVLALDPPGLGKSDKPDASYDLLWTCDRIASFLSAKGISRTSLIGGSMGGHLGMLLALTRPQLVDKLVLMGSSGTWDPPGVLLAAALKTLWNEAVIIDHIRRNWSDIYGRLFVRQTPVTRELLRYQMALRADGPRYAPEGRAFARALRSIFFHSCKDRLGEIGIPVLLIWGEHDQVHPPSTALLLRDRLPDARLAIVPDSGHEVMIDQTEVFNRLVLAFLEEGTPAVSHSSPSR